MNTQSTNERVIAPKHLEDEIGVGLETYFSGWIETASLQFEIRFIYIETGAKGAFFDLDRAGIKAAVSFVVAHQKDERIKGYYTTINPTPRTKTPRGILGTSLTKDTDYPDGLCRHILIDIDPVRADANAKTWNATTEEESKAWSAGQSLRRQKPIDGKEPIIITSADGTIFELYPLITQRSGNGWQAVIAVDGIAVSDHKIILQQVSNHLKRTMTPEAFEAIHIDTSVINPARVWRIPGTAGRKPGDGKTRPKEVYAIASQEVSLESGFRKLYFEGKKHNQAVVTKILSAAQAEAKPTKVKTQTAVARVTAPTTTDNQVSAGTISNAKKYIEKMAQENPAKSGEEGNKVTFGSVCKIVQIFNSLPEPELWELTKYWNDLATSPDDQWTTGNTDKGANALRPIFDKAMMAPATTHKPSKPQRIKATVKLKGALRTGLAEGEIPEGEDRYPLANESCDQGVAHLLLKKFGENLHFVGGEWSKWIVWTGTHWHIDDTRELQHLLKQSINDEIKIVNQWLRENASDKNAEKGTPEQNKFNRALTRLNFLKNSRNARNIASAITSAESEGRTISHNKLNKVKEKLVVPNGCINLRTGKLEAAQRSDLLTHSVATMFDPDAKCPKWRKFLSEVLADENGATDLAMERYVQLLFGCGITGHAPRENIFVIFNGAGGNGKSTLISVIGRVLGTDLAHSAANNFLLESNANAHETAIASIHGKRLLFTQEPPKGARLNTSRVKELTGGDAVSARRMREDFWSFIPECLFILSTNELPKVSETNEGIWRRVAVIPFVQKFADKTKNTKLAEELMTEAKGILAWMVEGAVAYLSAGSGQALVKPKRCIEATKQYRSDEDIIGNWIADCAVIEADPAKEVRASVVQESFKSWCDSNGARVGKGDLKRGLELRGVTTIKRSENYYLRLTLNESNSTPRLKQSSLLEGTAYN